MKNILRILTVSIIIATMTVLSACGEKKPTVELAKKPTYPNYAFDHTPTTAELRETVVRAHRDELTLQWYTEEAFDYNKRGAASGKDYVFAANTRYEGLPYCSAQRTLWGMLEYLDENGRLKIEKLKEDSAYSDIGQAVNELIGNTCTGSTGWALLSCCASIKGQMIASNCVEKNGFLRVGPYTYKEGITTFRSHTTEKIVAENGKDIMYQSYALALPGDLMVVEKNEAGHEHSTMVIENHVEKWEDGTLNPYASYIVIQDQHTGLFTDEDENGNVIQSVGHVGKNAIKRNYEEWFNQFYIPVTTAELIGTKPYTVSTCSFKNEVKTLEDLQGNQINSNYPQTIVRAVTEVKGKEKTVFCLYMARDSVSDKSAYAVKTSKVYSGIQGSSYKAGTKFQIQAILSTGEIYTLAEVTKK